jgi:hypothetical protein
MKCILSPSEVILCQSHATAYRFAADYQTPVCSSLEHVSYATHELCLAHITIWSIPTTAHFLPAENDPLAIKHSSHSPRVTFHRRTGTNLTQPYVPGISSVTSSALLKVDNISSHLRKRKAAEELVPSGQSAQRSGKRLDSAASKEGPPTPLTTATPMSSEDDFMSGMSSDEDDVLQESENEEGSADGTQSICSRPANSPSYEGLVC